MGDIDLTAIERFREHVGETHAMARRYAEGAVLFAAGDLEAAADRFQSALETATAGFHLKVAHGLCESLLGLGRAADAEPIARGLVEARPDLLTPHLLLGLCLLQQGRTAEALAVHREALAADIGEPIDRLRIVADGAVALDQLGLWEQGERWCLDAIERWAGHEPVVYFNLAAFQFRQNKIEAARDALRTARRVEPAAAAQAEATWTAYGDGSPL